MSQARPKAKASAKFEWPSFLQFAVSAFALVAFWTTALGTLFLALTGYFSGEISGALDLLLVAAGAFWVGVLLIPSSAYSLARLLGKQIPTFSLRENRRKLSTGFLFSMLPLLLLCGALMLERNLSLLLSPIHVAVASLTVGMLLWLGLHNLQLGSPQLRWGAFASGLTAAPFIAISLELVVGLGLAVLGIAYAAINPELMQSLLHLQQVAPQLQADPEQLLPLLHDFLADPIILSLIVANFALFVPLIEELIKPIAVWAVIWGRKLSPAQGFGLGLLSGAGFALIENLFSGASVAAWPATAAVRIGATAFHVVTSGLMGWALVRAKEQGRIFAVFAVYAFNILLHSLWNGVVILTSLGSLGSSGLGGNFLPFDVPDSAPLILLFVALLSVSILIWMNRRLQPAVAVPNPVRRARKTLRS